MITWGTYGSEKEAREVVARSGYPPGKLSVWPFTAPNGRRVWVVKLAYGRHRPFPEPPAAQLARGGGG